MEISRILSLQEGDDMKATLILNKNAISDRKKRFEAAQEYVDKKSLEYMTLYVPVGLPRYKNSGKLRDSGKIAGRGKIVYTAPKARGDYYNKTINHRHGGNPNATALWFETMKVKHKQTVLRGAAAIAGGKPK